MGVRICPKCGGKVSDSRNKCIHCGYVFPSLKKCPDCGELVDINTKECPTCGYPFDGSIVDDPISVEGEELENQIEQDNDNGNNNIIEEQNIIEETNDNIIVDDVEQDENLDELESNNDIEKVVCPYCGSEEHMAIGNNYYMCMACKGKFLDSTSQSLNVLTRPTNNVMPISLETNIENEILSEDNVNDNIVDSNSENNSDDFVSFAPKTKKNNNNNNNDSDSDKPSSDKRIIITIIAIVALIGIVVGVFFATRGSKKKKNTTKWYPETTTEIITTEKKITTGKITLKDCTILVINNIQEAGVVDGTGTFEEGTIVTLEAFTNTGYTFLGFFDGEFCLCEDTEYSFIATNSITLTAKWEETV